MNTLTIVAAQMGEVPESITGVIDSQKINEGLLSSDSNKNKYAMDIIENINMEKIRAYNLMRMESLIKKAIIHKPDLIVFPELALTSFFPYLWIENPTFLRKFFEVNSIWKEKVKSLSIKYMVAISYGYCELIDNLGKNIYELVTPYSDKNEYKYVKVHIPGHDKPTQGESTFQFEKKYFHPGNQYPVWSVPLSKNINVRVGMIICHDRRYNGPYIIMGLKGVQIILNGFNTPFNFMS